MARGFLSGVLWGGLVGVGVSSAASVLAPAPQAPDFAAIAPDAAPQPQTTSTDDSSTNSSVTDAALATPPQSPQVTEITPEETAPTLEDTGSAGAPQVDASATVLDQPQVAEEGAGVAVDGETPVQTSLLALVPIAPQQADALSIDTQPAALPIPKIVAEVLPDAETAPVAEVQQEEAALAPGETTAEVPSDTIADVPADTTAEVPADTTAEVPSDPIAETAQGVTEQTDNPAPETTAEAVTEPDAPAEVAQLQPVDPKPETLLKEEMAATEPETTEATEAPTETAEIATEAEPAAPTETAPVAPEEIAQIAPVDPPAAVADTPQEDVAPQADPQENTQVASVGEGTSARPSIGRPAFSLVELDTGVTIRRPSSANLGEVDDGEAQEVASDAGTQADADPRPISRNAQAFEKPADKPLMAIVLIDDGSSPVSGTAGISALRGFPYPLSFAVDTSLPDAAERMRTYRGEGFEVLAMVDLPQGAQATDVETTFGAILPKMADVVAVLEGTKGGLQGSREVSDQVTSILQQTGHGLLAQGKGLNTMPKLARKEGVPAEPVFRDFDSKGQTAAVIRRFLDQAAFKAGQEGAVVMLGRLRPDTVSALLLWGLQDRAGKVALSPISTVLLREE